ncbi:MAG: hypothetical protein ABJC13_10570 [Acidobacteriota bacterium]
MNARWPTALAAAVLAALVVALFLPTLEQGWAPLDDELNFTTNPHYRGLAPENLRWMATTRLAGHYIPLSWLTLAIDYELSGMDPRGYHRTNVLLHLANALLFFFLARRLLARSEPGVVVSFASSLLRAPSAVVADLAAFGAAALFALHPLRVESVAWITERRDLLCGLFVLFACHAYVTAAGTTGRRRGIAFAVALLAFLAALLSKGLAIALPVALVALDLGPLRRLDPHPREWLKGGSRAVWREKVPFVLLAAIFAGVTFWAIAPVMAGRSDAGFEHRTLSAGFGLWFYLEKTFLPWAIPFQLPATHPLTIHTDPGLAVRGFAFLALVAVAVALRRRLPALGLALAVYAAFVLPVSGLFQAGPQLAAHRYSYLAGLPLALLFGAGLAAWARRLSWRGFAAISVLVFATVVALGGVARAQVSLWRDDVTFSTAAVRASPDAWAPVAALARAHLFRGDETAALRVLRAGRERLPGALFLTYLEAVVRATSPRSDLRDGELALQLARQAARATSFQDPAALFALAAASAENGDSNAAGRLLGEAEALVRAGRKPEFLPVLKEARRRIAARGVVRLSAADWRRILG